MILDGVGREFGPREEEECRKVTGRYGIRRPFILWLGEFSAHKNVAALVGAFASLPSRLRMQYTLVLAGDKGEGWEDVRRETERRDVAGRVLFPGFISEPDLPALYSAEIGRASCRERV